MGDVQGFIDSLVPVVESPYKYYTVRIDLNNPDPETSCEYMEDAVGMTPGYDGWKDTNLISGIRPCEMDDNGQILGYYTNKEDMSQGYTQTLVPEKPAGNITDTMIEFPLMGYKLWNDDSYQYVSVTDDPNAENKGYCYYAHSLNAEKDCDKIYIGAFLGYTDSSKLHSTRANEVGGNITPRASTSLTDFRTYATNHGSGYSLISFFPWTLLQCLYVIIYKNLNSQAALGQGYTDGEEVDVLGTTLSQPFCYGDPNDATKHVKFLGIEDFYGNLYSWLDGVYSDTSDLLTDYRNSQMINRGHDFQFRTSKGTTVYYEGYISKIMGTNTSGFTKDYNNGTSGTESICFSDYGVISPDCFGYCGGSRDFGASAGAFYLLLGDFASGSSPDVGSRLMYKHLASSGGGQ